ncbi:MAG: type III secretion system export apparatus subunit SctS [Proteobacteria bacterium]|jgi:type III secretion protein S|nr:type III secretion system export apparatus subunit SctS [Pseudomonadota bacterium]
MNYDIIYIAKQGLMLSLILSLPVVLVASIVGLLFSMFQALTQIQDQSLSFAIKLVFVMSTLYMSVDWMASKIYRYALLLYSSYM